jgi:hypothetical protein
MLYYIATLYFNTTSLQLSIRFPDLEYRLCYIYSMKNRKYILGAIAFLAISAVGVYFVIDRFGASTAADDASAGSIATFRCLDTSGKETNLSFAIGKKTITQDVDIVDRLTPTTYRIIKSNTNCVLTYLERNRTIYFTAVSKSSNKTTQLPKVFIGGNYVNVPPAKVTNLNGNTFATRLYFGDSTYLATNQLQQSISQTVSFEIK